MLIQQVLSSVQLVDIIAPCQKMFTVHRTLVHHAAWLDQASAHCPIFLTAASRRSLDRVSVPARHRRPGGPLPHQPANVSRAHLIPDRSFLAQRMPPEHIWGISLRFPRLSPCMRQVAHALRTLPPVAINQYCYRSCCPSTCMC